MTIEEKKEKLKLVAAAAIKAGLLVKFGRDDWKDDKRI